MINTTYYQDLTKMNTFGMKVKARCFMEYDSVADLVDIEFEELARPVLHIGGGSNLLFTDDFKGTILHSKINFIEILEDGVTIPIFAICIIEADKLLFYSIIAAHLMNHILDLDTIRSDILNSRSSDLPGNIR